MAKKTTAELSSEEIDAAIALATRHLAALQRLKRAQDRHAQQQAIQRTLMARRRGQLADAQRELIEAGALVWIERARASETPPVDEPVRSAGLDTADAGAETVADGLDLGGEVPAQ